MHGAEAGLGTGAQTAGMDRGTGTKGHRVRAQILDFQGPCFQAAGCVTSLSQRLPGGLGEDSVMTPQALGWTRGDRCESPHM
jgi:hypothetical protein